MNCDGTQIATVTLIAGDFIELEFQIIDEELKTPVDLTTFQEIRWLLFPYGDPYVPALDLKGNIFVSDKSRFNALLRSDYTKDLTALYVQQILLIDNKGKEFRPIYGQVEIITRAYEENSIFTES